MTTIVIDRELGCMAGDRRVTANDSEVIMSCPTKVEKLSIGGDTYLVGLAGLEGTGFIFLEWLENGDWDEPPEPMFNLPPEDEFSALVLTKDEAFIVDKYMQLVPLYEQKYYGIGTGGIMAWAVLEAGCTVDVAMRTAIKMDPFSGNGFDVCYLDGAETFEST